MTPSPTHPLRKTHLGLALLCLVSTPAKPLVARGWGVQGVIPISQGALTLDAAMQEALGRSPVIGRAEASVGETHWRKNEAFATGFLPKLAVTGTQFLDKVYTYTSINFTGTPLSFPGFYPSTQFALDVSLPVFNGLANIRRFQAASLLEQASEKELTRAQFQLAQDVRLAFYQALAADLLETVAEQNVKTLEDHLQQIRVQKQGGVATKYDTLRVEVQLSEARSESIDSKDNSILTRKKLTQLLALEDDNRPLSGALPIPDGKKIQGIEITDVQQRPDIEALGLRAEAADRQHSANGAWLIPSISLFGQGLLYNSQLFDTVVTDTGIYKTAYNIGVRVSWNLFDGGVSLAQSKASAFQAAQAEKSAQAAKLQVPYDLAYWKRRYLSNSHHYQSKKLDIERSQESVRLAKEERAGTRTTSETLDALLDLFRARAGVLNAQVGAAEALIRLELALGRRTP